MCGVVTRRDYFVSTRQLVDELALHSFDVFTGITGISLHEASVVFLGQHLAHGNIEALYVHGAPFNDATLIRSKTPLWFPRNSYSMISCCGHKNVLQGLYRRRERINVLALIYTYRIYPVQRKKVLLEAVRGLYYTHTPDTHANKRAITEAGMYSGAVARAAELRKHTQNDSKCAELSWKCIPLARECYGAWCLEALKAFSQVANCLAIRGNTSKSMALTDLFGRLSHRLTN